VGTALIHSLAVTDKRGLFKSWTLLLAVAAFSLSLLGTFLVRSGVLVSVHSFAADPRRGIFILGFLIIMIGGALTLYAWRAPRMVSQAGFELVSREAFLLFNNLLLVIAATVVFGGTMAPLIAGTLHLGTLSVGPPYFNPSFLVPVLPLLALLSLGIHARWRRGGLRESRRRLLVSFAFSLVLALALVFGVYAHPLPLTPIGAVLGVWIILSSLIDPLDRLRRGIRVPAAILGMAIAHIGLGMFVLGITFVQSNTLERDIALKPGGSVTLAGYNFRFDGVQNIEGPNYEGLRGTVTVTSDGKPVTVLHPEKRRFWVQGSVQTTAAIADGLHRDLLASLGDDVGAGAYSLRFQYRPLIRFVWLGAFIMAMGGVTVVFGRRQRGAGWAEAAQPSTVAADTGSA
jgi:cytochrome c-type biogenesis protein CcmF